MSVPVAPQSIAGEPTLRVVCSYCPAIIAEGDAGAPVSHGLCDACDVRLRRELAALLTPVAA